MKKRGISEDLIQAMAQYGMYIQRLCL